MDITEPGEVFVQIAEFPDYFISNFGRVWSEKNGGRLLKPRIRSGYLSVAPCKDGVQTNRVIHRLVAKAFVPNPDNKPFVDHIDGNKQNNMVTNLRFCTNAENLRNRGSYRGSSSKYVGVHWHTASGKWQAKITINGKNKHLGLFTDEQEAARVYDAAARELHGEFARLNFSR